MAKSPCSNETRVETYAEGHSVPLAIRSQASRQSPGSQIALPSPSALSTLRRTAELLKYVAARFVDSTTNLTPIHSEPSQGLGGERTMSPSVPSLSSGWLAIATLY